MAVVVPRHARARDRQRADHIGCRTGQGPLLATLGRTALERTAGEDAQPATGRVRWQAHQQQVGGNFQVLA